MSEIEVLEGKLQKIRNIIADRIKYANDSMLPGKIEAVVETFGEFSDWGGGEYHFFEKNLGIKSSPNLLEVDLGYNTKTVFSGKLLHNGVADIYLYVPGGWEKRIEEIYNKVPEAKKERELKEKIETLQNNINKLTKEWELEESL